MCSLIRRRAVVNVLARNSTRPLHVIAHAPVCGKDARKLIETIMQSKLGKIESFMRKDNVEVGVKHACERFVEVARLKNQLNELTALSSEQGVEHIDDIIESERDSLLQAYESSLSDFRQTLYYEENDQSDCYVEVNAGAGGLDAMDWARMLAQMYLSWARRHGHRVQLVECSGADNLHESELLNDPIRSAVLRIGGAYAYGALRVDDGVHRLVRLSPYKSGSQRHTSFASVSIREAGTGEESDAEHLLDMSEVRIDTYRASGVGGQHVNTTDSAVRVTHVPTGVQAHSQAERSQHLNRRSALALLAARLRAKVEEAHRDESSRRRAQRKKAAFNHLRTYTLHPYTMVKDARSQFSTPNASGVLDGADIFDAVLLSVHLNNFVDDLSMSM